MYFLPRLRCCLWRGRGSSCAWGGGPLGERAGEWRDSRKEPNLYYWKDGLWIALCMDIIPYSQLFEDSRVCPRMVSTSLCNDIHRLSHLLCRYGWSQSFYSVSNSAHQNLKLF